MSEFELVLEFPDQSPSFAHGFEAGQLWQKLRQQPQNRFEQVVSDENRDLYLKMAKAAKRGIEFRRINDDGWEMVIFTPAHADGEDRRNVHAL